jgi:serine/threonine-protein kinase
VLATPWADVAVDGQPVGTTPMGRPIALAPGLHFVTFTHPTAPPVTRDVVVEANAAVLVDVTMDVAGAARALGEGDGG